MSAEVVVARRYARALYELITEGADHLAEPLQGLAEVTAVPEVRDVLAIGGLPSDVKVKIIREAAGKLPDELERLLSLLAERNKLALLPLIHEQVTEMIQSRAEAVDVELVIATRLPAAVRNKVVQALESVVGKKLNVTTHQNKEIIGGFIVNIGDRRIDHSIRTRINGMRAALAG